MKDRIYYISGDTSDLLSTEVLVSSSSLSEMLCVPLLHIIQFWSCIVVSGMVECLKLYKPRTRYRPPASIAAGQTNTEWRWLYLPNLQTFSGLQEVTRTAFHSATADLSCSPSCHRAYFGTETLIAALPQQEEAFKACLFPRSLTKSPHHVHGVHLLSMRCRKLMVH